MLTPEQISAYGDSVRKLCDPITEFLLEDIARRISEAGQLTSTAAYQIWRTQKLGMSQKEIKKRLQKMLKTSRKEIGKLLRQSAEVGYRFDLDQLPTSAAIPFEKNTSLQQIVEAAVNLALDDFTNITQTIGMVDPHGNALPLQDAYRTCTDYAFKQVITGAADYNTAIRRATKNLAEKGLRTIDYESGVHTSLEAAVRRNIMGGLGLMQEQISQHNHDELGADGWELSAHANSAPDHEPIQGKQYTDAQYQALNNSLQRRIGTLNCGHVAFPIILGVNEPQYTKEQLEKFRADNEKGVTIDGKHYTGYEATQMQRRIERAIRAQKRRVLVAEAAGDADTLLPAKIKLQRLRQEYSRFSEVAGLRTEPERLHMAGFGRGKVASDETKWLAYGYKREYNTTVDREQFERYRRVLKEKVPATFAEFQRIKRDNPDAWDTLKKQYRVVNQYKVDSGEFTVDEILKLDNQLITEKRERFTSKFKYSGNIAGAYVDQEYYLAHSNIAALEDAKRYKGRNKLVLLRTDRSFQYIDVQKADGSVRTGTFHDTEAKLFEEFAAIYNDKPFKSITMISERGMCDSCKGVMKQFMDRFPDVSVRVISNKKVEGDVWKYRRRKK